MKVGKRLREMAHRIVRDLLNRRNVDAYVVVAVTFALAVTSAISDVVSDQLKWAASLTALALLVYRVTLPESRLCSVDDVLENRSAFEEPTLSARLRDAREVVIFAPSAIEILSEVTCQLIRGTVLQRSDGVLRVVVLNPEKDAAIEIAAKQLDDAVDYSAQRLSECLQHTLARLFIMETWNISGDIEHRKFDYNPGFSIVAIDPSEDRGTIIVEFHALHNESISTRMHVELTRANSSRWYRYWKRQLDYIWQHST